MRLTRPSRARGHQVHAIPPAMPRAPAHPLVLRYAVKPDSIKLLGLSPASPRHERAMAQVAAIAIDKAPNWISYSRNKNHYSRRGRRYDEQPDLYRYSLIPPAVDALGFPRKYNRTAPSILRMAVRFPGHALSKSRTRSHAPPIGRLRPRAVVQLRDEQKQLIDFRDTELTHRKRAALVKINEAIVGIELGLPADIGERRGDFLHINGSYVNLGQNALWRIFNVDFRHGGRFYGAGFQSLPKEIRQQLTIDGEPVAEPDYPAHHLNILYALEGLSSPRPNRDHYDVDGYDRSIVKRAVLILINARTRQSAIGAIVHDPELGLTLHEAHCLLSKIRAKHKAIERYFHSNAGCRLQRLDSDMVERVLLGLFIRQGVPVLPIHDSFVVPQGYEDATKEQMDEAFETVILRERGVSRITKLDQSFNPKTTYTVVSTLPVPSVVVPSCLSLGARALFDTVRRITPLGRIVTLQAQRRRDIRQDEFDNLIGISRPTLSNILAGRFGASPQTAERIAEIIATTPAFERQPFLPSLAA